MSIWERVKSAGKNVVKSISKTINLASAESKANHEASQIKKIILLKLSIKELQNMAHLMRVSGLEYEQYLDQKEMTIKRRKIKPNKFDYVDEISKKPSAEIILKLRHLRKTLLADELEREIDFIDEKLKEQKTIISEGSRPKEGEAKQDLVLSVYMNQIVNEIIAVNPEKHKNEREYQIELKGFLKSSIKKEFPKQKVSVEVEYAAKAKRRMDIIIIIDSYKIGIETKYDLSSSGKAQRAVGQLLEYSRFLDGLILVQYSPLDNKIEIENLKELSKKLPIPFKVIANGNVKL